MSHLADGCEWEGPACREGPRDSLWQTPSGRYVRTCGKHVADAILKDFRLLDREEALVVEVLGS